jgi:hypothetical protein
MNTRLNYLHERLTEREGKENPVNLNPPLLYTNNLWDYHFLSLSGRADRIYSLLEGEPRAAKFIRRCICYTFRVVSPKLRSLTHSLVDHLLLHTNVEWWGIRRSYRLRKGRNILANQRAAGFSSLLVSIINLMYLCVRCSITHMNNLQLTFYTLPLL